MSIHRLFNPSTSNFITAQATDVSDWTAKGFVDQGHRFYAASSDLSCTTTVRTLTKGNDVRQVTTSRRDALLKAGWSETGAAYWAMSATFSEPDPTGPDPAPAPPTDGGATDADADGKFSIAVIPDTQDEVYSTSAPRMQARNKWILANAGPGQQDIRLGIQVGDLVSWDTSDHYQYKNASEGMQVLEAAGIPWVGAIGNHDTMAVGEGGSGRQGVDVHQALRDTKTYNSYFPPSRFKLLEGAWQAGKEDNSYHVFSAGGRKWLVVVLEFMPRTDPVSWAKQVVESHPNHNVIVVTHAYLDGSGNIGSGNAGYGDNSPQYIWKNVVKPYKNVSMVFSGHVQFDRVRIDTGDQGNKIISTLQDKNTQPYVRIITVDVNAGSISSKYFSTSTGAVSSGPTTYSGFTFVK